MRFFSRGTLIILILVALNLAAHPAGAQTAEPTAAVTESATIQPLTLVWQTDNSPDSTLAAPSDLAVDDKSNIYISSQSIKHIKKFDKDGKLVTHWAPDGKKEGEINDAEGIAVDAQGNVYIADFFNTRIQKFDGNGNFLMQIATESPSGPASPTVDSQGNVYVLNFFIHDHPVQKFDGAGKLLNQWGVVGKDDGQIGATKTSGPFDIAVDHDGNIYIADRDNQRIQKFDSDGKFVAKFGDKASSKGNGQFYGPLHLTVDTQNNLYVLDGFFLQKFDSKGNFIAQWATQGGDLDQASTVAVDSEGNIYVTARAKDPAKKGMLKFPVLKKFKQP